MIRMEVDLRSRDDLLSRLGELGSANAARAFTAAAARSAAPLVRSLRAAAPVRTGALRRNISVRRARRNVPRDTVRVVIASRSATYAVLNRSDIPRDGEMRNEFLRSVRRREAAQSARRVNPAMYWHLAFGGARPHIIRFRNGFVVRHPGSPGNDAMRRIASEQGGTALAGFADALARAIERIYSRRGGTA